MANVGNLPAISRTATALTAGDAFVQRSKKAKATAQRRHQSRRV
jgi:hypothetical protein